MATSSASVIFMDRTLDLVAPMSHTSDCVMGTIYEVLPRLNKHNNDVAIDMCMLFSNGNRTPGTLFPGCLAHHGDSAALSLITDYINKSKKDCLVTLCKKLTHILESENILVEEKDEKATIEKLRKLLLYFK